MRAGTIEPQEGTRLVYVLWQITSMITAGELEARIAALEELSDEKP